MLLFETTLRFKYLEKRVWSVLKSKINDILLRKNFFELDDVLMPETLEQVYFIQSLAVASFLEHDCIVFVADAHSNRAF